MTWALAISAGMNILGSLQQYKAAKAQAKAQAAWQKYSNTMARISNGQNQNAITENEIQSELAFAEQAVGIKRQTIMTEASAEVNAAAAGVKGRSVNQAMLDINRNAAEAERQRQINLTQTRLGFDQERRNSAMAAEMSQDYSYIPKPSLASYLLSAAQKTYSFGQSL